MRYVKKDLNNIPPSLTAQNTLDDIELIAKGNKDIISDKIYKGVYLDDEGKTQSRVRDFLNVYYKHKCAYCELFCKAEIEHYRPKNAVLEDKEHPGYYWLCYHWSNLVPSCRYCNTEGGKGTQFPIINNDKRVKAPSFKSENLDAVKCIASGSPLIDEEPFLLHPEIDEHPENFLAFNISDDKVGVKIVGIDVKERGKKTIKICNLNRTYLKLERLKVFYEIKERINTIFDLNADGSLETGKLQNALNVVFRRLEAETKNDDLTHTLLRRFVISSAENFENHFSSYLEDDSVRVISVRAFQIYKSRAD